MQPVPVRQATFADLESLVPLFEGDRQFYGQPSERDRVRDFLNERLTQGDSVLFIADADGRAVGFTQLYPSFSSVSMARIFILTNTAAQALYASAGWERDAVFSVYHFTVHHAPLTTSRSAEQV